jgi:AcrR family transcriptional regulator
MEASPKFSRLEADARREQILAAARGRFASAGLAGASMAEIAEEAGVTRGLLNHYFGTKRELYLAVVAAIASELPDLVAPAAGDMPGEDLIDRNLSAWFDQIERNRELWEAISGVESVGSDPEVAALLDDARDRVIDRMAVNWAAGGAPTDELRLVLRVFLGAAEAAAREWSLRGRATREQAHAIVKATLLAMVALPQAQGR